MNFNIEDFYDEYGFFRWKMIPNKQAKKEFWRGHDIAAEKHPNNDKYGRRTPWIELLDHAKKVGGYFELGVMFLDKLYAPHPPPTRGCSKEEFSERVDNFLSMIGELT